MAQGNITNHYEMLIIGGSAGSLEVLIDLLPALRKDLQLSIVVVVHRGTGESLLPELLADKTSWTVREAEDKETILPKTIYVAPADYHLLIEHDRSFSLDYSEKVHHCRPAIDVSFETAAEAYGSSLIGLLLSGANADGAEGLSRIKKSGGLTIVQDPQEASVAYMPQQALDLTPVDYIATTADMKSIINKLA